MEEQERKHKRNRPQGTKKAKEKEADRQPVQQVLEASTGQAEESEAKKMKVRFMNHTSANMDKFTSVLTKAMAESSEMHQLQKEMLKREEAKLKTDQELQIANSLSPQSSASIKKQMYHTTMAKLKREEAEFKIEEADFRLQQWYLTRMAKLKREEAELKRGVAEELC